MKLFCYYTWHSFVNTIKKVMKTWMAVMLACLLIGLLIGFGISLIQRIRKEESSPFQSDEVTFPSQTL